MGLVPVAFASLSLFEEGPYEGVHDIGLVLLQPVTGPRYDVESEMVSDVESARLGHLLLQEGVSLAPQQQNWGPDVIMVQREGAKDRKTREMVFLEAKHTLIDQLCCFCCPWVNFGREDNRK